jgi:hypothetical protein
MRVRVSLDLDILMESFISLCIIETVGAILLLYFAFLVKWVKSTTYLRNAKSL